MATGQTDFREYLRGEVPPDWTERWADGGWVVRGMPFDAAHRNQLRRKAAFSASRAALSWNVATGSNDQEVLVNLRSFESLQTPLAILRGSGSSGSETAYIFGWDTGTTWRVWKLVAGVLTSLASGTGPKLQVGRWLWLRFQVTGTTVRGRVWEEGDVWPSSAGEEPTSWTASATDSAVTTGWLGVGGTGDFDVDSLAFGTAGGVPPLPSARPRSMEAWTKDPSVAVDVLLEVEGGSRSTGATTKEWYSRDGRRAIETDYPGNVDVHPVVKSITIPAASLAPDSLFSGAAGAQDAKVVLKNDQALLDTAADRTYAGRRIIARAGEKGSPLRTFEPVWSGLVKAEPGVNSQEVTFETSSGFRRDKSGKGAASSWLDTEMAVRRNIGIPTCLESISGAGNDRVTIPSHAAYDVTSFCWMSRFSFAAPDPTSLAFVAARVISGANFWSIFVLSTAFPTVTGILLVQASFGGVGAQPHQTAVRVDDGALHSLIFAVRDQSRSYLMIDGKVVSEYTPTASIGVPTGAGIVCGRDLFGQHSDFRLTQYMEPDEASAYFSQRAEADDRCLGMWRLDDGLGSVAADASATANDASVFGTEGTNFRWGASLLGDEDLAGQFMPFVSGQVFNAEAPIIDAARGIARYADQEPELLDRSVRIRGFQVEEDTDYADADGCLTFEDQPAEPITVSVDPGVPVGLTSLQQLFLGEMALEEIQARVEDADETRLAEESFEALDAIVPWSGGAVFDQAPKVADYLKRVLETCGANFGLDRWGRVAPAFFLPTINPGPYGLEPLLEFTAAAHGGIAISPDLPASLTGSFCVAFWWKGWAPYVTPLETDAVPAWGPYPITVVGTVGSAGVTPGDAGFAFGLMGDQGRFGVEFSPSSLDAAAQVGVFQHSTWNLTACTYSTATNTTQIWNGALGDAAMVKVAEQTGHATVVPSVSKPLFVGAGFSGSVCYLQVYNAAKTGTDFTAMLTGTRPTAGLSNLVELFPMTEGEGDVVRGAVNVGGNGLREYRGKILGARWCPRVTVNVTDTGAARTKLRRALRPAWKVEARWRQNHRPLEGADIADLAPAADKSAMRSKYRSATRVNDQRGTYPDSREITLETCLASELDAVRCAGFMADRFAPGCEAFDIGTIRRQSLALHLGDEVLFQDARHAPDGRALRVITLQTLLDKLEGDLAGWGVED